jgi:tetratricopeptide (TPR) repeat protein
LNTIDRNNLKYPYAKRSLSYLNPWLIHFDSNAGNGIDGQQINRLLKMLVYSEQNMAGIAIHRRQFNIAEVHCQRYLAYSKRFGIEGEEKTSMIFRALLYHYDLREKQDNKSGAIHFAEDAYNLVVEAYDCVHPQVQEAAGVLIHGLIAKGDYYDAERYAQVTYSNLRDKKNGIDQDDDEIATSAYNLAYVLYCQKVNLAKAEEYAREALNIRTKIHGSNDNCVGRSCDLLAEILRDEGKLGDETMVLYKRSIAILKRIEGPDGLNVAAGNMNIGRFYS